MGNERIANGADTEIGSKFMIQIIAFSQQFGRSGETYGRLFAAMREEFNGFVQRRVDANMATFKAWGE